jgi:hypothetical protein
VQTTVYTTFPAPGAAFPLPCHDRERNHIVPTYQQIITGETRKTKDIDEVLWYETASTWSRHPLPEPKPAKVAKKPAAK